MRFVVCSSDDCGHFAVVEAADMDTAAQLGVDRLVAEWPDDYTCRDCEGPHLFEVHVHAVSLSAVFTIGHDVRRKES